MSEATTTCSHCGAQVPSTSRYCPSCGAPAPEGAKETPRDTTPGATQPPLKNPEAEVPEWAREPAAEAEAEAEAEPEAEPEIAPPPAGLVLDWDPELLAELDEAARLEGLTTDRFLRQIIEPAVKRVLRSKRGLLTLDKTAAVLGITRREVIQMINNGRLRARKVEGEWKVEQKSIDQDVRAAAGQEDQIELDLRELVETSGLSGLEADGDVSDAVSATLCYVNQAGVLVAPRGSWKKLGRERLLAEAKDAVRRWMRRRDREMGRI